MAKKIVRGITDVKTINNQDYDTNNVNDLLSDGQYSYIHRKKGKSEEYHNLTDNIKTISSDNTDLLTVTNNNKTNNTATLHPKHDAQKEQVLESERSTVTIKHGTNGTPEKTKVDTNPEKVLEHSNLLTDNGISKRTTGNTTKLGVEYRRVDGGSFDLNNLVNGKVRASDFVNAPATGWLFVSGYNEGDYAIQRAISLDHPNSKVWVRCKRSGTWDAWREQVGDKSVIDGLLSQKQNKLTAMGGISISGNSILLTGIDNYRGDLNNLTNTCTVKPDDGILNLPTGVRGHGILTAFRINDVISQKYHSLDNNMYARICRYEDSTPTWTPWVKVATTTI